METNLFSGLDLDESKKSGSLFVKQSSAGTIPRNLSRLDSLISQSLLNLSDTLGSPEPVTQELPSRLYSKLEILKHPNNVPLYRTNAYLAQRKGVILSQDLILKSDHFPNSVISDKSVHIWGAPNFNYLPQYSIAMVGQPTMSGFRSILNYLRNNQKQLLKNNSIDKEKKFHIRFEWLCVREEPTIYLGQRPFVLRELNQPTMNMDDFRGITGERLEIVESKLKADILEESGNYDKNILIHDEVENQQLLPCWCAVGEHSDSEDEDDKTDGNGVHLVATPREIIRHLSTNERYDVTLRRAPLPAEGTPAPQDIDRVFTTLLMNITREDAPMTDNRAVHTVVVFNDQLGKGRALYASTLLLLLQSMFTGWSGGDWPHKHAKEHPKVVQAKMQGLLPPEIVPIECMHRGADDCLMVPPWLYITMRKQENFDFEGSNSHCNQAFLNSETYQTELPLLKLHELIAIIPNGLAIQREVDWALHNTSAHLNLKLDLAKKLQTSFAGEEAPAEDHSGALGKLRKYALLLVVCYYLRCIQTEVLGKLVDTLLDTQKASTSLELLKRFVPAFRNRLSEKPFSIFLATHNSLAVQLQEMSLDLLPEPTSALLASTRALNRALTRLSVLKLDRNVTPNMISKGTQHIVSTTKGLPQLQHSSFSGVIAMGQPTASGIATFILSNRITQLVESGLTMTEAQHVTQARSVLRGVGYTLIENPVNNLGTCDDEISLSDLLNNTPSKLTSARVLWINLREEPVVYIKRLPWVLRSGLDPNVASLSKEAVFESTLKNEVIAECNNNTVYLDYQKDSTSPVPQTTFDLVAEPMPHCTPVVVQNGHYFLSHVTHTDVQSPKDVYGQLDHLNVDYKEISLGSHTTPSVQALSHLIHMIDQETHGDLYCRVPTDTSRELIEEYCNVYGLQEKLTPPPNVVLNCHRGTRRSGLGLVLVTLVLLHNNLLEVLCEDDVPKTLGNRPSSQMASPMNATRESQRAVSELSLSGEPAVDALLEDADFTFTNDDGGEYLIDEDEEEEEKENAALTGRGTTTALLETPTLEARKNGKTQSTLALISTPSARYNDHQGVGSEALAEALIKECGIKENLAQNAIERGRKGLYRVVIQLMRALPRGRQVKETVDLAIDSYNGYNLRDEIDMALELLPKSRDAREVDPLNEARVVKNLECYALLMMAQAYLMERAKRRQKRAQEHFSDFLEWRAKGQSDIAPPVAATFQHPNFASWLSNRPELTRLLPFIRNECRKASMMFHDDLKFRWGSVLAKGTILKNDAFVGIRNTALAPLYEGVLNFRFAKPLSVVGVGIPSIEGIAAVLKHLSGIRVSQHYEPLKYKLILWFNVREEPILYVNEKPFVLRDLYEPYVNVENTGIQATRTLAMENQLRRDVVVESLLNKGSLTIHDENNEGVLCEDTVNQASSALPEEQLVQLGHRLGNLRGKAFDAEAEKLKVLRPGSVLTAAQAFKEAHKRVNAERISLGMEAVKMVYLRYPITDEQAPIPEVVKELLYWLDKSIEGYEGSSSLNIDIGSNGGVVVISNCQMGRGRTTTSMIISSLWALGRGYATLDLSSISAGVEQVMLEARNVDVASSNDDEQQDTIARLKDGFYSCIKNLILVLPGGALDKWKVDRVIDLCETMQNLRTVVYQTQKLYDASLQSKKKHIAEKGRNFLLRYAMLICIGSYLFNIDHKERGAPDFVRWMHDRPEIQHALRSAKFPE